jgi:hypothetical protein
MKSNDLILTYSVQCMILFAIICPAMAQTTIVVSRGGAKHVDRKQIEIDSESTCLPSGLRRILQDPNSTRWSASYAPKILPTPSIWPFGLLPVQPILNESASSVLAALGSDLAALPAAVDHSLFLPPVGDQGDSNACVAWAVGYYLKSYQEGREWGWSLDERAHQFSPAFIYNQLQNYDEGSGLSESLEVLAEQGCATLAMMPYDANHLTWPSADFYRQAIPFRALSYDYLGHGESPDMFACVKALVAAGELCVVGVPVLTGELGLPGSFESLSDGFHDSPLASEGFIAGFQALTIVGYDESMFQGRGAYKIVNSWGTGWGDQGFAWLSEAFLRDYGLHFYCMTDRIDYQPEALLHITMEHGRWYADRVSATVGLGLKEAPIWSKRVNTRIRRNHLFLDKWIDMSEARAFLPPSLPDNPWWVRLNDYSPGNLVTLHTLEIEAGSVFETADAVLPVSMGGFADGGFGSNTLYVDLPTGEVSSNTYYVNDDLVLNDWDICTAPGDDNNDGLSPASPRRSVQEILDQYVLKAGDTVWIDAGAYNLHSSIEITQLDRGQPGNPVRFVGTLAPNGELATIIQGPEKDTSFSFYEHRFVKIENLWIRGGQDGIRCTYSRPYEEANLILHNVRVSGSIFACFFREAHGVELRNCLIHECVNGLRAFSSTVSIENSTIVAAPITLGWGNADLTLNNSILMTSGPGGKCVCGVDGSCKVSLAQFNNLVALNGAEIGFDANETNFSEMPLFANPEAGDFHLMSSRGRWDPAAHQGLGGWVYDSLDSPCIDAGSYLGDYSLEPDPHGGRLNVGAFGGTAHASKSAVEGRYLFMDTPVEQSVCRYTCGISWRCYGSGWKSTDTLSAQYSDDNGQTWHVIPEANARPYRDAVYTWDVFTVPEGADYTLRLVCKQDPNVVAYMEGSFIIDRPAFYYVNDASLDNDVYCRSAGNDNYDGQSPATPKATIQAIIGQYALEAGDVVYIDTGTYVQSESIVIGPEDGGDMSGQVQFIGSDHPQGSLIDRARPGTTAIGIHINNSGYVALENLAVTGAGRGVHIQNAPYSAVQFCRIYGNSQQGLKIHNSNYISVKNSLVHNNGHYGVYLQHSQYAGIQGNLIYDNGATGIGIGSYSDLAEIVSNTICWNGNGQVYLASSSWHTLLRSNIIWANGPDVYCIKGWSREPIVSSDYNNLYATNGAYVASYDDIQYTALGDWQSSTGFDDESVSADPLFVDPWGPDGILGTDDDDWHLQSTNGSRHDGFWQADGFDSPCIDAGDPFDDLGDEPMPNGGRINMGAFGGTRQASKASQ